MANPTKPEEEIWSDIVACGEQDIEICIIDEEQNKCKKNNITQNSIVQFTIVQMND